jgi:hypothetical protein
MLVRQYSIQGSEDFSKVDLGFSPDLFLLYVSPGFTQIRDLVQYLGEKFPGAVRLGCSTSGEIHGENVGDDSVSLTAISFKSTKLMLVSVPLEDSASSFRAGKELIQQLDHEGLKHVLVLSDGLNVNGADLVLGLREELPSGVSVTGGLAGDGADFGKTFVVVDDQVGDQMVGAVGFYGEKLSIGYGSVGGWVSFGMEREVTRSEANVLFELDGRPALEVYKSFLGDKASGLPGTGLLFPLSVRLSADTPPVVRTILAVNEEDQSLTFAGNIPQGSYVRLMKANFDRLIDGAGKSGDISMRPLDEKQADLAILISCVGRRLVLKQMVEEEIEAVRDVIGDSPAITGFYSYGEIAPFEESAPCQLHNQTMTVTTLREED